MLDKKLHYLSYTTAGKTLLLEKLKSKLPPLICYGPVISLVPRPPGLEGNCVGLCDFRFLEVCTSCYPLRCLASARVLASPWPRHGLQHAPVIRRGKIRELWPRQAVRVERLGGKRYVAAPPPFGVGDLSESINFMMLYRRKGLSVVCSS